MEGLWKLWVVPTVFGFFQSGHPDLHFCAAFRVWSLGPLLLRRSSMRGAETIGIKGLLWLATEVSDNHVTQHCPQWPAGKPGVKGTSGVFGVS